MATIYSDADDGAPATAATRYLRISWSTGGRRNRSITRESITTFLSQFGTVQDILLIGDKGKAFVSYSSAAEALAVYNAVHKQTIKDFNWLKLFVTYVAAEDSAGALQSSAHAALGTNNEHTVVAGENSTLSILEAAALADVPVRNSTRAQGTLRALPGIPGMLLIHDFLTAEEEVTLIQAIDAADWTPQLSRRVQHYGHLFDYRTRTVTGGGAEGEGEGETPPQPTIVQGSHPSLVGPVGRLAASIAALGFIGDAGDSRLDRVCLCAPVQGLAGFHALCAGWTPPLIQQNAAPLSSVTAALDELSAQTAYPQVDQVTVNEYLPGRGIAAHVDTHSGFEDGVVSVSLLSDIVMEFTWALEGEAGPETGSSKRTRAVTHHVPLPRRSLLLLRGESRYAWTHRIPARSTDYVDGRVQDRERRVSATFRCIRRVPCRCSWPSVCFDQEGGESEPAQLYSPRLQREKDSVREAGEGQETRDAPSPSHTSVACTPAVEATFVHAVYDAIAPHFSSTRHSPWPRVEAYLRALPVGSLVLDVGCGNGKYMGACEPGRIAMTGCDRSEPLVSIAAAKGYESGVGDAVRPPYRDGCADAALSIAVLHHISTRARRVAVLASLLKAVRPGGQVLVYVWAQEQGGESKRVFGGQDVLVPWCLHRRFFEGGDGEEGATPAPLAALERIGGRVDEARAAVIVQRYCHVYIAGEIEGLCAEAAACIGAGWCMSADVHARAVAAAAADKGGKDVGNPAPASADASVLVLAGRPGDARDTGAHRAESNAIPDVGVQPARGPYRGKGQCGAVPSPDAITARLTVHASGLVTRPAGTAASALVVTALDLWWERDNWCILLCKA